MSPRRWTDLTRGPSTPLALAVAILLVAVSCRDAPADQEAGVRSLALSVSQSADDPPSGPPLLTLDDVLGYDEAAHAFYLSEGAGQRFVDSELNLVRFELAVNGQVICEGQVYRPFIAIHAGQLHTPGLFLSDAIEFRDFRPHLERIELYDFDGRRRTHDSECFGTLDRLDW